VVLTVVDAPLTGAFTVAAEVQDLAGNPGASSASGEVFGLAGDLGTPLAPGGNFTADGDVIEVVGGGYDLWGNYDEGYFAYKTVQGDFDARVRVDGLTLATLAGGGNIAKAGLMVRASVAESNSPTLHLLANPPPPGRNQLEAGRRTTVGGATASWGTTYAGVGTSNLWLRLTRSGDAFAGYWSSNGLDWTSFASATQTMPAETYLGLAVTCHTNFSSLLVTGAFSGFNLAQAVADVGLSMTAVPAAVLPGGNVTYALLVTNQGPAAVGQATVTDVLPAGAGFVSANSSQGTCSEAGGVVTCSLGALSAGASATVTIVVTADGPGPLVNTASLVVNVSDPNEADNTATSTVPVVSQPQFQADTLSYSDADGGSFSGTFQTVAGIQYVIEYKDKIDDTAWTALPIAVIVGDGGPKTFTDPGPLSGARFYRIRAMAP
jgi:uncharacterized repeat protein (TIGR01451 family)